MNIRIRSLISYYIQWRVFVMFHTILIENFTFNQVDEREIKSFYDNFYTNSLNQADRRHFKSSETAMLSQKLKIEIENILTDCKPVFTDYLEYVMDERGEKTISLFMDELLLKASIITHMFVNKLIRSDEEGILYIRDGLTLASVPKHEHPIRIGIIPAFIRELGYKLFRYTEDKRRENYESFLVC